MKDRPIILIVDDHTIFRCALGDWLSLAFKSCKVEEAENGEDALARIQINPPDIVITDNALPGMNGLELVRKIKALSPETLVLVLSTRQGKAYQEAALRVGAVDFINKLEVTTKLTPLLKELLPTATGSVKAGSIQQA